MYHQIDWNMDADIIVDLNEIVVVGNNRTKLSYFESELKQTVFNSSKQAGEKTVNSYCQSLNDFTARLLEANLFDHVDSNLQIESMEAGKCKVW